MARFRGTLQGARAEVSRLGHSNLDVTANGWECGVAVRSRIVMGQDMHDVYMTTGSSQKKQEIHIGSVTVDDDGNVRWVGVASPAAHIVLGNPLTAAK